MENSSPSYEVAQAVEKRLRELYDEVMRLEKARDALLDGQANHRAHPQPINVRPHVEGTGGRTPALKGRSGRRRRAPATAGKPSGGRSPGRPRKQKAKATA